MKDEDTLPERRTPMESLVNRGKEAAMSSDSRCKEYAHGDKGFESWLKKVDARVLKRWGVGLFDLPDMLLRDAYESGISPALFVEDAVAELVAEEFGESDL